MTEVGNVVTEPNLYCHYRAYQHDTSAFGSLHVPCDALRRLFERVYKVFVSKISTLQCKPGVFKALLEEVDNSIPVLQLLTLLKPALCGKGREHVSLMLQLYLECRLHYYFKFETRHKKGKKSRKAQILMNR